MRLPNAVKMVSGLNGHSGLVAHLLVLVVHSIVVVLTLAPLMSMLNNSHVVSLATGCLGRLIQSVPKHAKVAPKFELVFILAVQLPFSPTLFQVQKKLRLQRVV